MTPSRHLQLAAFVVVIAVYLAVRLWGLTDSCLWFDEIFGVHAAEHPWGSILAFVALDLIHPPLFYILLKGWIGVGGEGLLWLRLFPVVFSVLAILPFLALCRELKLPVWTRVLALFLLAINGSLIKYAQEVRMYSPLLCLSLFSIWLFARYFFRAKGFIPLVVVNLLLVYIHYFGWFVIAAEVGAIVIFQREKTRRIVAMLSIVAGGFLPWVLAVWQASKAGSSVGQNIGWVERPGLRQIWLFILDLIEPSYFQMSSGEPASNYLVSIPILAVVTFVSIATVAKWKTSDESLRQTLMFAAVFIVVPVSTVLLLSWLSPYSIWGTRHLIIVIAPVAILTAISILGLTDLRVKAIVLAALIVFCSVSGLLRWSKPKQYYSWCRWESILPEVTDELDIYTSEDLIAYHIWFPRRASAAQIFKVRDLEGVNEDNAYFLPRGFDSVRTIDLSEIRAERFRFAYRAPFLNENEPPLRQLRVLGYKVVKADRIFINTDGTIVALMEKE